MGKTLICKRTDIPQGGMLKASVGGVDILVANVDGQLHAVADTCTHAGASLSEGRLDGCTLTCGWHGAQFDCKTGGLSKFPAKIKDLARYTVITESDDVFVEV